MLTENFGKNGIGFIARYKSPMASHHIDIWSGDSVGFAAVSTQRFPGNFRTDKPFPLLGLNQWHQMKLKAKGKTFTFWINDQKVLAHKDEAVKKGAVGIGVGGYTVQIDNVEISGPEVPEFTPPTWKVSKFYLNGVMKEGLDLLISGTRISSNSDEGNISIGSIAHGNDLGWNNWRGIIDELRIWN